MKKLVLFLIFPLLLCSLCACRRMTGAVNANPNAPVVLLFAGLDDAAENADALILASFSAKEERVSIMQIPRDTYYAVDFCDKLNGVYAARRFAGEEEKTALSALSGAVSEVLSVPITGTVAFKASALRAAVDALGGVRIEFPEKVTVEDKTYEKGEHFLMGEEAEAFVRYREGYAMGDLGRIEAQKLFLCALLRSVRSKSELSSLLRLLLSMRGEVITDLSTVRALSLGISLHSQIKALTPVFFTLPGEALPRHGRWYFIPNRQSAVALLSEYFPYTGAFDEKQRLFDASDAAQENIYTEKNYPYTVYTEEDLSSLHIPIKKQ